MSGIRTYIQQTKYNGSTYTKGSVVDILDTYKVVCQEFPFMLYPEPKDLPKTDWPDEDGADVYVPADRKMKEYDMNVDFLYKGDEANMRTDLKNFIDFLYGKNTGAVGSALVIYNEYTEIGRKDVVVSEVPNELYYTGNDPDAVAKFKVKFTVYDPVTDVAFSRTTNNGTTTLNLSF